MEFGRVNPEELQLIDFNLPPNPQLTTSTLQAAKNVQPTQVYVGCAKCGRKEWVGKIYPPKTKDANFLDEYVKHFDSIEACSIQTWNLFFEGTNTLKEVLIITDRGEINRNEKAWDQH